MLMYPHDKYQEVVDERNAWQSKYFNLLDQLPDYVDQAREIVIQQRKIIDLRYDVYKVHKDVVHWRKPLDKEIGDLRFRLQEGSKATLEELIKLGMRPHEAKFHASMFLGDMDAMAEAAPSMIHGEPKDEAEEEVEPETIPLLPTPDDRAELMQTTRDLAELDRIKQLYGAEGST